MTTVSLAELHQQADAALADGRPLDALNAATTAVTATPDDHRGRLKVAAALAALEHTPAALAIIERTASQLLGGGYALATIAACQQGLKLRSGTFGLTTVLGHLHEKMVSPKAARPQTLPPPPAVSVTPIAQTDSDALIKTAIERSLCCDAPTAETTPTVSVPFFSEISKPVLLSLVPRLDLQHGTAGHRIIEEGAPGTSLFIIVEGQVEVTRKDFQDGQRPLAKLGPGTLFGEMALLGKRPRSASVTAATNTTWLEVGQATLSALAQVHPNITEEMQKFARRRLTMNLLATSKLFAQWDLMTKLQLLTTFETRSYPAGTSLVKAGEPSPGLHLIAEGQVEVSQKDADNDKVVLAYLKIGDVFGEIGLIEDRPATAQVTTTDPSLMLVLPRQKFDTFIAEHPELADMLKSLSSERQEETESATTSEGIVLDDTGLFL